MLDPHQMTTESNDAFDFHKVVPAARPLSDFSIERVGDDVILYDSALDRYHTMNIVAYEVWRSCDGRQSVDQLGKMTSLHREVVQGAVDQLGEAGLLDASELSFASSLSRRRLAKLAAAGAIGVVGIPLVKSVTVPDAASAATGICPDGKSCSPIEEKCCCFNPNGQTYTCAVRQGTFNCGPNGNAQCCGGGPQYCIEV